jgi:hypothetical protein
MMATQSEWQDLSDRGQQLSAPIFAMLLYLVLYLQDIRKPTFSGGSAAGSAGVPARARGRGSGPGTTGSASGLPGDYHIL